MTSETMHEVKSAAAVLADDVICQSFIQSSSTLAYACLLIRRRQYDLAVHVLHSLEAKQASRFKDMVFYLQAQIGIETGEFATVKKRLVPRVHQHPNDMVALSLLECCIYHEWQGWAKANPAMESAADMGDRDFDSQGRSSQALSNSTFGNAEAISAAAQAAVYDEPSANTPVAGLLEPKSPPAPAARVQAQSQEPRLFRSQEPIAPRQAAKAPEPAATARTYSPSANPIGDVGIYQTLATDPNTQALAVWNPEKGKMKSACRNPELEPLVALLPQILPASMQAACTALESGVIHKICCSFQTLTVTSFHSGSENLGVVTGNINQSLLTIVRAENTFRKQAAMAAAAPRPSELAPNE